MATKHLNQIDLAARWNISHRTLERWRWTGEGPRFVKLGGRVATTPDFFECRFCPWSERCWGLPA